jgi:ribosomal protein L9
MMKYQIIAFLCFIGAQSTMAFSLLPMKNRPGTASSCQSHACNTSSTSLFAKKKVAAPPQKLQVKLLQHIPGTGHKGDIVQVTPAFYQNKLQPTRAAELVTDEQVNRERALKQAQAEITKAQAKSLQEQLQANDFRLVISKKAGPDGHLFGGINAKLLMSELQALVNDDFLKNARVKAVLDSERNVMHGDIKHVGTYEATIELTKEIAATFALVVEAE